MVRNFKTLKPLPFLAQALLPEKDRPWTVDFDNQGGQGQEGAADHQQQHRQTHHDPFQAAVINLGGVDVPLKDPIVGDVFGGQFAGQKLVDGGHVHQGAIVPGYGDQVVDEPGRFLPGHGHHRHGDLILLDQGRQLGRGPQDRQAVNHGADLASSSSTKPTTSKPHPGRLRMELTRCRPALPAPMIRRRCCRRWARETAEKPKRQAATRIERSPPG